ncbi:hypothetical protein WJX73_009695 [Symbiochloris irregularis]|uniref:Borealin N-terminal domain-containing protein n=1 Tax=Symbiochloris irregularis TaxID=706552 RepID=A0AAW1P7Z2_9CHLO
MPPKRRGRAAAKKQTEVEAEPEAQLSDDYLRQREKLVAELEAQVQERQQQMAALGEEAISTLRTELYAQMLSIPKSVREMPFKLFKEKYGGDLHNVILEEICGRQQAAQSSMAQPPATALRGRRGRGAQTSAAVPRTTRKAAAAAAACAAAQAPLSQMATETPSVPHMLPPSTAFTPAVPGTMQRVPKLGETFFSARGSPLGVFERDPGTRQGVLSTVLRGGRKVQSAVPSDSPEGTMMATIIKRPQPGSKTQGKEAIVMTAKDGSNIEIDCNEGIHKLPKRQQAEARANLEAISKRIDGMLGKRGTVATRRR